MTKSVDVPLTYDWLQEIAPYLDTMQAVEGGYSLAKRGVGQLTDGTKVFVKIAEGDTTKKWLAKEIRAYQKLNGAKYPFIPKLLSCSDDRSAMAIEHLAGASFDNIWDKDKLDAILEAQEELKKYSDVFADDPDFTLESVVGLEPRWPVLLAEGNVDIINGKFARLGLDITFTTEQLEEYEASLAGWSIADDTLVHQDVRADNFGYDPDTKKGKLVDWNWLCLGDESLDRTPLFVNMFISGFDPYRFHPETYDPQMLKYLISFWLERVLSGDEEADELSFRRMLAQATSVKASVELLNR